jgi:hypothetical protein
MKTKTVLMSMLILVTGLSEAQDAMKTDLPKSSFSINPLGLLQFGPMLQFESRMGNSSAYLVPHLRLGYLGVLTHVVWTAFEDNATLSPLNLGLGLGVRALAPMSSNNNAMYYGGFLEYSMAKANYDVGETDETVEKAAMLTIMFNTGYRWRFPSGRFLNLGLYAGPSLTLSDEERYVQSGELYATYNETLFIGMLELSFGWEKR